MNTLAHHLAERSSGARQGLRPRHADCEDEHGGVGFAYLGLHHYYISRTDSICHCHDDIDPVWVSLL